MKQQYKKPVLQSISIQLGVFGDYGEASPDGGCDGGGHHGGWGGWGGWWGWWGGWW